MQASVPHSQISPGPFGRSKTDPFRINSGAITIAPNRPRNRMISNTLMSSAIMRTAASCNVMNTPEMMTQKAH